MVRSPEPVAIGRWNYLTVWRDENKGGLQVNQQKAVEGRSKVNICDAVRIVAYGDMYDVHWRLSLLNIIVILKNVAFY